MYKYLILLFVLSANSYAFDYGKVRISLPKQDNHHQLDLGRSTENSNDLIDSTATEIRYLYSINSHLRVGLNYATFNSDQSSNGKRVKEDLAANGIIQELELKDNSIYLEAHYRVAKGVIHLVGGIQTQIYLDVALGYGQSNYTSTKDDSSYDKRGWMYSLELGSIYKDSYLFTLMLKNQQDGINHDLKNNQTYLGLKVGHLW